MAMDPDALPRVGSEVRYGEPDGTPNMGIAIQQFGTPTISLSAPAG